MRLAVITGGLIGLGILVWLMFGSEPGAPELGDGAHRTPDADFAAANRATATGSAPESEPQAKRTDVSPPGDAPEHEPHAPLGMGRIEGTVRYHDRKPAADTPVYLQALTSMTIGPVHATTRIGFRSERSNREGEFAFGAVRPGNYAVRTPRGKTAYARVEPGKTCKVRLTFDRGVTATVTVLRSDGRPIEGAQILTNEKFHQESTHVAGRTDARGIAELPDLQRYVRISARAKGFAPSDFRMVSTEAGESVELTFRLQPGGATVKGQVLGIDGNPVAGAAIDVRRTGDAKYTESEDGRPTWLSAPVQTRTDSDGSFELPVPDGTLTVRARASNTGVARQPIDAMRGQTSHVVLRLPRAARVFGVVRNERNKPAAQVQVRANPEDWFERSTAITDAKGRYELADVADGQVALNARRLGRIVAEAERTLVPGQEAQWNPAIAQNMRLLGRLVGPDLPPPGADPGDRKTPRYTVMALQENRHTSTVRADRSGQFSIAVQNNMAHTVIVQRELHANGKRIGTLTLARKEDVRPSAEEILIPIPGAAQCGRLTATLTTRGEHPLPKATLLVHAQESSTFLSVDASKGEPIEIDGLPAGTYFVQARAPGFTPKQPSPHKLPAGGLLAIGEIVFETGFALEARLTTTARPAVGAARVKVFGEGNLMVESRRVADARFRTRPLEPGKYRVTIAAAGLATTNHAFEIVDRDVDATIELPAGVNQPIRCRFDGIPTPRPKTLSWSLFRVGERGMVDSGWTKNTTPDGVFEFDFAARAGRYRLYAGCGQIGQTRYHGHIEFELSHAANRPRELVLRPRKPK